MGIITREDRGVWSGLKQCAATSNGAIDVCRVSRLWTTESDVSIQGHGAVNGHGIISSICSERATALKGNIGAVRDRLGTPRGELSAIGHSHRSTCARGQGVRAGPEISLGNHQVCVIGCYTTCVHEMAIIGSSLGQGIVVTVVGDGSAHIKTRLRVDGGIRA